MPAFRCEEEGPDFSSFAKTKAIIRPAVGRRRKLIDASGGRSEAERLIRKNEANAGEKRKERRR
jgi:hypothetical protein